MGRSGLEGVGMFWWLAAVVDRTTLRRSFAILISWSDWKLTGKD